MPNEAEKYAEKSAKAKQGQHLKCCPVAFVVKKAGKEEQAAPR